MLLFILMKKFFNKIKNLYKFLVQIFFKRIYGKIIYASHHKNTNNLVIKKVCSQTIKKKENFYQVYLIKKGRICTDYVENVSIIDNNKIVDNASYQQIKGELKNARFNSAIKRGTPYFKKTLQNVPYSSSIFWIKSSRRFIQKHQLSYKFTLGYPTRAMAMLRRLFMPPDNYFTL